MASSSVAARASRKILHLTYVEYEAGSFVGQFLALVTLTPIFALFCLASAFLVTRKLTWAWTLVGALLVDFSCAVMKQVINQPRPQGSYRAGPGMPSEHAAFATFCAVYLCWALARRVRCARLLKAIVFAALVVWAFLVIISRHHLGVHSAAQLLAGAGIGTAAGAGWILLESVLWRQLGQAQRLIDWLWAQLGLQYEDYDYKCADS